MLLQLLLEGVTLVTPNWDRAAIAGLSIQEIIQDGVTGLLVPPSDVESLTTALVRLRADPASARRMGQAGPSAWSSTSHGTG